MIQASSSENTIKPALSMLMPLVSILQYAGRYKKFTKKRKVVLFVKVEYVHKLHRHKCNQ